MSKDFYSENEEINFEDSLNKFEFLFKEMPSKPPTLEEALVELFRNAGLSEKDSKDIYAHLNLVCNNRITEKWELIRQQNPKISREDALIISSYTYEPQTMYEKYSPYRILNTNLVENDRKKGVINVEKYLFLFLRALRSLQICKKDHLFRCINRKVELEEFLYIEGLSKTFWAFTSTSDVEKISEKFLNKNGEGTKYKIVGDNLWGYDITLFNVYDEKEILLEPETEYYIEKVKKGNVIEVTCKVWDKSKYKLLNIINAKMKVNVSKIYLKIYIIYSVL